MSARQSAVTFYYHLLSQPSRALKIFLDRNQINYIPKEIQLAQGEHLQPEYEAINPFKKVPCISHNGFILTESVAILRYLCREFSVADHWYPKDSTQQARVDEFLEWQHIELRAPLALYFRYKFLMPMLTGKPPREESVDRMFKLMVDSCDKMENIWLKDKPYLCGNIISIADILGACEVEQPRMAGYDPVEGRPKLKEWMNRIKTDLDPYYADAHTYLNAVVKKNAGLTENVSKLAVALGTDMLELDCHLTRDRQVVVSHDHNLLRVSGKDMYISQMDYKDLPILSTSLPLDFDPGVCYTGDGGKNEDRKIPLLSDVFKAFPDIPINIDIKVNDDRLIEEVSKLITQYRREHITVWGNFSDEITKKCYKQNPNVNLLFSMRRVVELVLLFYSGLLPFCAIKESQFEVFMPSIFMGKLSNPDSNAILPWPSLLLRLMDVLLMRKSLFQHLSDRGIQVHESSSYKPW